MKSKRFFKFFILSSFHVQSKETAPALLRELRNAIYPSTKVMQQSIILFDCEKWGSRRRITSSKILMSIKAFIFPHYSVCSFFWDILAYVCRTFKTHCQNIIKSFSCQFSFFGCLWILHRSLSFRKSFDVCNYIQCLLVVKRSMLRIALCLNATAGIVLPPFQSE